MVDNQFDGDIHCADFVAGDKNITYGFTTDDVEKLIEKVLSMMQAGGVFLPSKGNHEALEIEVDGEKLVFAPGAVQQLASSRNERAHLLSLTVNQEYQRWATRFVALSGKMDVRQIIEGLPIAFSEIIIPTGDDGMQQAQPTQRKLESIVEALQSHSAFVILGDPGGGKTTTQQKLAFDAAHAILQGARLRVPLFVRLSQQKDADPYAFLEREWERRTGTPFADALSQGRVLILADGINEIPREKRNETLAGWRVFEQEYRGRNQLIFSGRTLDYDNQLNLPRVQVEPLDRPRISEFLKKHQAEALDELMDDAQSRLYEMARNPLNLFVLAMTYLKSGKNLAVLSNRGRLFLSFTQELLQGEQLRHLDEELSVDMKVTLYAQLAYAMQQQGVGTTFELQAAKEVLPENVTIMGEDLPLNAAKLFHFGRGATILDPITNPDIRFYHHLLQEYFAARELLRRFNQGEDLSDFWRALRLAEEMPPADVGEWDPLPEPPTTGWEVTTILAAGLARSPEKLIAAVQKVNPILAGRCLDEAGLADPEAVAETRAGVRQDLLADLYDPQMDLRTRLLGGFILGRIGDPRFPVEEINNVKVILPTMVDVPAGEYLIGSPTDDKDTYEDESPPIKVKLGKFQIGKWSVTNAEYACFMAAGGYENEAYWQTDLARRWLVGEEVTGGQYTSALNVWKYLQNTSDWREIFEKTGSYSPDDLDSFEYIAGLSEEEFNKEMGRNFSKKSRSQPDYWDDARFNNPSQPVVGITWFEAQAYCAWLSEVTEKPYRLPTEAEWEAAARGVPKRNPSTRSGTARIYPWGDEWDAAKANSVEGRVQKTSPVGAYTAAGNLGPFETEDQSGNVWNWTSSLYLPYPYDAEKSEVAEAEGERILRGGSWFDDRRFLRAAARGRYVPDYFNYYLGFRLLSPGSVSGS